MNVSIQLTLAKNFRLSAALVPVSTEAKTNLPGAYHAGHVAHCPSTASGSTRTRMKPCARPAPGPVTVSPTVASMPTRPGMLGNPSTAGPAGAIHALPKWTGSTSTLLELSAVTDRGTGRSAQWPTE